MCSWTQDEELAARQLAAEEESNALEEVGSKLEQAQRSVRTRHERHEHA